MSSCVQGDLYELYEDESLFLSTIPRTKQQLVDPKPWYEPDEANIGENQCAVYALMKKFNKTDDNGMHEFQEKLCIANCGYYTVAKFEEICHSGGFTPSEMVAASGNILNKESGYNSLGITLGQSTSFESNFYIINIPKDGKHHFGLAIRYCKKAIPIFDQNYYVFYDDSNGGGHILPDSIEWVLF